MNTLLLSEPALAQYGDALRAVPGADLECVVSDPARPLPQATLNRVKLALMTQDVIGQSSKTDLSPQLVTFSAQLQAATALQWLHVPTAGVDRPIFLEMLERGVRVTTSSGANAEAVAHTALAGFMALARGLLRWHDAQRTHRWEPVRGPQSPRDLAGQTAIVVGQGPIGRRISALLAELGLRVLRVRRTPRADSPEPSHGYGELKALAASADWIILACPLSEQTRHLVDAQVLQALPRGACVINVGRGGVLHEPDLVEAVRRGHIAGAYLDVFEAEPLPPDSPIWDLPNVLVSPHSAGSSQGQSARSVGIFIDNLPRWLDGQALHNEVAPPGAGLNKGHA
jgi:D-2-hydroxyacid dehydrogenase (NADP+)